MESKNNSEQAVDQFGDMVYHLALAQTKKTADAEDVFQEVFLRLVKNDTPFENDEHLKAWLIRVTINCSHNLWRKILRRGEVPIEDTGVPDRRDPSPGEHSEVYEGVLRLPPKYRAVIHLYYYEEMSIESIGKSLKIGYDAAAKRLSRARKLLRQELTEGVYYERHSDGVPQGR